MATKKVKIKVKKKKVNFKRIVITLIFIALLALSVVYLIHLPLKNIYIVGNRLLSDKTIIELAKLEDYPPYINTYFLNIEENLLKNEYIKDAKINRKFPSKIILEIEEYKPLAIYNDKLILSSGKMVATSADYVPYIINNIDKVYDKFVESFAQIDDNILLKISHIEYAPNEVDKERFILYMVDDNYVHITLSKVEKLNKYNSIVQELDNQKGIIYLDSGDYVDVKKKNSNWHKMILII